MPDKKMGNPLQEAAATGMLAGRKPITSKEQEASEQKPPPPPQPQAHVQEKEPEITLVKAAQEKPHTARKGGRQPVTLLLSPAMKKWLKIRSAQEEREMSDIAEEAMQLYQKLNSGN